MAITKRRSDAVTRHAPSPFRGFSSEAERAEVEGLLRKLPDLEDGTLGAARLSLLLQRFGMVDGTFDWRPFLEPFDALSRNEEALADADVVTLRRMFTVHVRLDHEGPGHLARAIADGRILRLFNRLADLRFAAQLRESGATRRADLSQMPPRTSDSVPLDVAWVSRDLSRIGLTYAPGKRAPSRSGPAWDRSLRADLDRLVDEHRVDRLIVLLSAEELATLGIPDLVAVAERRGLVVAHFPLSHGEAPSSPAAASPIVEQACEDALEGLRVVFVARSLGGRASMFAACTLVTLGFSAEDAFATLARELGKYAFEREEQRSFVRRYAQWAVDQRR